MKLQQIESGRTSKSNNLFGWGFASKQPDDIDEQKINLIKSFAIPNTKEDILEFAVLAASNVDRNAYDESYGYLSQRMNARRRDVSNAWMSKLEQAYQKAKIVLAGDPRLNEIQALYDSTHKSVNKVKWRMWKLIGMHNISRLRLPISVHSKLRNRQRLVWLVHRLLVRWEQTELVM